MLSSIPQVFPFFKKGPVERSFSSTTSLENENVSVPTLKVSTDREAYRPGDLIIATVEVHNAKCLLESNGQTEGSVDARDAILIENIIVEVKGIEKFDTQWIITQKPSPGSKLRQGERAIFDSTPTSIVSNITLGPGSTKTYMIRAELPKVLPTSFRGTVVRYLYYLVVALRGRRISTKNEQSPNYFKLLHLQARNPLNIWTTLNNNNITSEEGQSKDYMESHGIISTSNPHVEIFWKEKEDDSDWSRADETLCGIEDDYVSNNHMKGNLDLFSERSFVSQSPLATPRNSFHVEQSGFTSFKKAPKLTALSLEAVDDGGGGALLQSGSLVDRPSFRKKASHQNANMSASEPVIGALPSEAFLRGRSYNIRIEDQVVARFSPKNPDATYYFGDTIGGVLTFFHEEVPRRCLEVSVTLEYLETVNPLFIHPSRKHSPVITKIQSEYHEVVADIVQTHFMFSIPMDGPMSFSTPHVSLQWILRFEFITTSKHVDWRQYGHPLLIEEREKGEWLLPITVHSPLPRTHVTLSRKERAFSPNGFWVGSPGSAGRSQLQSSFFSGWETSNGGDAAGNYAG